MLRSCRRYGDHLERALYAIVLSHRDIATRLQCVAVKLEEGLIVCIVALVIVEPPAFTDMPQYTKLVFIVAPESHDLAAILYIYPALRIYVRVFGQGRDE